MQIVSQFYTYLWLREDGTPYYVGKGSYSRAFRKGCPLEEYVIVQEWPNEYASFAAEKFLIAYYGRKDKGTGILRNLTDGGEGCSGMVMPESARRAVSESLKGNQNLLGYKHTAESLTKISESAKLHPLPKGTRTRPIGYKHSEETKQKIVNSNRKTWREKIIVLKDYPHGTYLKYKSRKCRCKECKEANTNYERLRKNK